MKKATIQDIASELGVSRNTVSKAINNAGGIAEATRERVLQKAIEMGYKQFSYITDHDGSGTDQKKREKGEIALLCGNVIASAHYISQMLVKLKKDLPQYGYTLNTYLVEQENFEQRTLPLAFDPARVSAVLCVELFDRAYDEMICSLGLPVLFVDGPIKRGGADLPADQLYMDSTTVITRFVSDMLAQGRRRIGYIGGFESCQSLFERYSAFRCAMLLSGAPVEDRFCITTDLREEIESALTALSDFPDVFVCAHDMIATEVIYILRKLGRSVPGDVLVCGFNDLPNSRIITPTLTTVHIHTAVMAVAAIQLLLTRIESPGLDFRTVHTETELIYRNSTRI